MAENSLFRKAALDKLASPERLDVLMQVTSPKAWISLVTMAVLLSGVVVWGVVGRLPERIEGQGMLTGEGGLRQIRTSGPGTLDELNLAIGDTVEPDQEVGTVSSVEGDVGVRSARERYQSALAAHNALVGDVNVQVAELTAQLNQESARRATAEADLKRIQDGYPEIFSLTRLRQAEGVVTNIDTAMAGYRTRIQAQRTRVTQSEINLNAARAQLDSIVEVGESSSTITSTVSGRVVSIVKQVGDTLRSGDLIAEVEAGDGQSSSLEVIAFVSSQTGQRVQPGHPAQITVAGIPREEYGFMRGEVKSISQYPESPASIAAFIGDSRISEASYRVVLEPVADPSTPTGFAWSTGQGPNAQIAGGTGISVAVEVDRYAPISKVLPVIRGTIGG